MKKILSIALCAVMLFSVMLAPVYAADEHIDARFLTDYGQTVYFMEATTTAPIIDAAVQEGEYAVKVETTFDKDYDTVNDSTQGGTWGLEWANYYLSWDEECLYIAAEILDNTPTQYAQWSNVKRADQFCFALGGMIDTPAPEGIASYLAFRFFDGNSEENIAAGGAADHFEIQDVEKDFMFANVSGAMLDISTYSKDHLVNHDPATKVTTYEVALNWAAIKSVWPHHDDLQFKLFTFGAHVQDTSDEINDQGIGTKVGIKWWGIVGETANEVYDILGDEYDSAAIFGYDVTEPIIPNMFFLGTEAEYEAFKAERLEAAVETEPAETEPAETEPADTEPAETEPADTDPAETTPTGTTPAETEPAKDGGCGASIAAVAVALVATLGTCTIFLNKKR